MQLKCEKDFDGRVNSLSISWSWKENGTKCFRSFPRILKSHFTFFIVRSASLNLMSKLLVVCSFALNHREIVCLGFVVKCSARLETRTKEFVYCKYVRKRFMRVLLGSDYWKYWIGVATGLIPTEMCFVCYRYSVMFEARKMVNYARVGQSLKKFWWKLVVMLTCNSLFWFECRGERPIEPSGSWFLLKFPLG